MKKSKIALGLSGIMAIAGCTAFLTACGSDNGSKPYEPGTKVKVGLICLHGDSSTYDKNFIDAWKAAFQNNDKVVYDEACIKTDIPEDNSAYEAAKALVKQGCNMIFADSFGHGEYIKKAAKEFPNIQFCHATGTDSLTGGCNNLHNAFASIYEGRYLAGIAAGKALINKGYSTASEVPVGYVGAYPYAEVKSGYTSWFLGLRTVFPKAKMSVKFTNSWYYEDGEREAANALIAAGCVLISQHADSMGAPSACENHTPNKIPNVSYNIATQTDCPNTYVAFSKINWAPYYTTVVDAMYSGRVIEGEVGRNWTGTLASGSVEYGLTTNEEILSIEDRNEVKHIADGMKVTGHNSAADIFNTDNFTVTVDKTSTDPKEWKNPNVKVNGAEVPAGSKVEAGKVTGYLADTTGDFVGDTEVILTENGITYFAESHFRSAPYFDIDIDGIKIV